MHRTLKRKIEDRTVEALRDIIKLHPTMAEDIKKGDKDLSYDGYIRLFMDGDTESDKQNFDADIPIQIKGHEDKKKSYFGKERISWPVDIDDLKVYFRGYGCLYFQIFVSEDGCESEIYYNSLFPSKIRYYLEFASRKKNKHTYNINFVRLDKNPYKLEVLCRQFATEMISQGSGRGQIVSRLIDVNDLRFVKNFSFKVVGAKNPYDALRMISSGDVVIHGSYEDDGIEYPVGIGDSFTAYMRQNVHGGVYVGDVKYYDAFRIESSVTAPGEARYSRDSVDRLYLSPNLSLVFGKDGVKFNVSFNSDIMQIANDAKFLVDVVRHGDLRIDKHSVPFAGTDVTDEFMSRLDGLAEVGSILQDIGCKIIIPFKDMSEEDKAQIDLLVQIKKGIKTFNTDKTIFLYDWKFDGKIFPFIIEKDAGEIKFIGLMYNRSLKMSYGSPEEDAGEQPDTLPEDAYIVPNFVNLSAEQLGGLYYYDYESMFDQIDDAVINDNTEHALDYLTLSLIGAYDISENGKLLEIAKALLERLIELYPEVLNLRINMFQIEKRIHDELSEAQIKELKEMDLQADEETQSSPNGNFYKVLHFCIAVLLDDKVEAGSTYGKFNKKEKEAVEGFPIMNLYERLVKG